MSENAPCSSHRAGMICADGFVQVAFCGGRGGCIQCGTVKTLPYCQRDEVPEHMVKPDGSPLFYAIPNTTAVGENRG